MALMQSNRDQCIFNEDGFIHLTNEVLTRLKQFWRCKYKRECKAQVHTGIDNLDVLKRINEHINDSEGAEVEAMIAINRLKNRMAATMEPTSIVINELIPGLLEAKVILMYYYLILFLLFLLLIIYRYTVIK